MLKKVLPALMLLAVVGYLAWRFLQVPGEKQTAATSAPVERAVPVKAVEAKRDRTSAQIHAVGTLLADESIVLRPEIAGRVQAIHVAEGRRVRAGELLIELNSDEQRAAVSRSEAQENLEKQSFQRIREVRAKNLVSQQQYDESLARLKDAGAQLEQDRVRLAKSRLTAPFAGVLGLRQVSPGDYVSPGQALVNLEAIDPVKIDFRIPEKYAGKVSEGMPVGVSVDAFPGRVFMGAVYAVDPRLDESTRTLRLRARLANPELLLKPGMFARIELNVGAVHDAVFVPEQALVTKGSQSLVFSIEGEKVTMLPVKTGERRNGTVEVVEGLEGGEWIVTEGQLKLRDGMTVTVIDGPAP